MFKGKATVEDIIGKLDVYTLDELMAEKIRESRPKTEFELNWIEWAKKNNVPYSYKKGKLVFDTGGKKL